ncbi:hypothetical protein [Gottfriedia acidiceleris]|uniref:hypothetical protein n=1 Tax=Gottfriedia acidiceleris TaxID=371036 RepID=UPI003B5874B8
MMKRNGATKRNSKTPIISNTGFIGASFIDMEELQENQYYFTRKHPLIIHEVLNGLLQAACALFQKQNIPAYIACEYLREEKKIGLILSKKPFEKEEGIRYFIEYLREIGHLNNEKTIRAEISNTGFIGVIFVDLSYITRFTFETEMKLLSAFAINFMEPLKEIYHQNKIHLYMSGVELQKEDKLGFVLSKNPYDERKEANLYFKEYLRERGMLKNYKENVFIQRHRA